MNCRERRSAGGDPTWYDGGRCRPRATSGDCVAEDNGIYCRRQGNTRWHCVEAAALTRKLDAGFSNAPSDDPGSIGHRSNDQGVQDVPADAKAIFAYSGPYTERFWWGTWFATPEENRGMRLT